MSKKLPPNVISDILSRLPAKTLLRFKCVSKPWCSLISGPDFIKLHLQKSSKTLNNYSLVLRGCYLYSVNLANLDVAVELDHPLKTPTCGTEMLGSCNGLLLLSNSEEDIVIWNISTRKLQKLPVTQIEFPEYFTFAQYILYGFGYDSVNDDYKVVRIIQFYGQDDDSVDSEVKVYSLRANSWTRIRDFPYYMKYKRAWGVLVNGCLHWVVSRKPESDTESFVVAFNLETEEYVEVSLPNFVDKDFHMNVGVLGGCLSLHCNCYQVCFDVWVMKAYGVKDSWVKLFSISIAQFGHFEYFAPLVFLESGGEVLLNKDGKKLVWYDIKKGSNKNVSIRGLPDSIYFEGEVCVGSLVPLNGDGGIDVKEQAAQKKKRRKRNKKKRNDISSDGLKLVSGYPAEVVADILSRLHVKTLLRCQCVCKPWYALISDPHFIRMHLKRSSESNTNLSIILRDSYLYSVDFDSFDKAVELDHPLKSPFYGTDVLGSCDGLLCLYNSEDDIVLWNLSTTKWKKLPSESIDSPNYFTFCQYIIYGFGYDPLNKDYKVVRIVQFFGEDSDSFDNEVKVYSQKKDSWRRIQDFPYYLRYKRGWGVFVCGALHWVVTRTPELKSSNLIVAFDLGVEEYREIPLPNFPDKNFHMNIDVLGGCLCILCNYSKIRVDMWVMKDYDVKKSWTKLLSVEQPKVIRSFEFVRPLAYSKSGSEVLLQQDNEKLLWFDIKKKTVKKARIRGMPTSFDALMCVGGLVMLNSESGIDEKKQAREKKKNKKKNRKKRDDFQPFESKLVLPFPLEVVANILSRLPVKTLLRFKCVSKPWQTLLNDPDFVKRHLKKSIESNRNRSLILRDSYLYSVDFDSFDSAIELDHPLKSPYYGTDVLGSCNGLLCLYNSEEDDVLLNPSTKEHKKVPGTPIQFPTDLSCCQYIIYGFGYDPVNDDYKIVRIAQFYGMDDDSFESEVRVYSLKTNSWRRIQKFPYYLRYKRGWGMFASGSLHWVATRKSSLDTANIIAAFDLGVEQYREVPQPNYLDKSFHMNLAVLGGSLCILCNYREVRVDVWVLKDYGVKGSWTRLFSIAQHRVIRSFDYVRPLAYSNSGNEVLLEQDNKNLLWYDLKRDKVKNVKVRNMPDSFDAEICVESLVPLNGDTGIGGRKQQAQEKKGKKRDDFLSFGFKLVL